MFGCPRKLEIAWLSGAEFSMQSIQDAVCQCTTVVSARLRDCVQWLRDVGPGANASHSDTRCASVVLCSLLE